MAGYIGGRVAISSPQQIETKHTLTATASQTSIPNIGYTVGAVHVYQNGVRLVDGTDYTATNGSTVTLETGATEGDQIVIVSHGSFETGDVVSKASGGTFSAAMNYPGGAVTGDVTHPDSIKAKFGAGDDLQIYHDPEYNNSVIKEGGTGDLLINASNFQLRNSDDSKAQIIALDGGAVTLHHNNAAKLATTATGATITGALATDAGGVALTSLDIDGGTDIGAALVDADLMIVDDGAGGTNRKATMTRLATYMGSKITGGSMVYIASSGAISGAATADFTGFDSSKYDHYIFYIQNLIPATDAVTLIAHAAVSGTSYDTTSGNYHYTSTTDFTGFRVTDGVGSSANEFGVAGKFSLFSPHLAAYTYGLPELINTSTSNTLVSPSEGRSAFLNTGSITALRFNFNSGNIESGEIVMYGIANGT
jgi:hypothetical protein